MNIFKVLASGRKSFQEETASAIIAWFMNPEMEHGLGYLFLSKLLKEISIDAGNHHELKQLATELVPKLRADESAIDVRCNLEFNVGKAFIDIVFEIKDWILAIENKIYSKSATEGQLAAQYEGLKKIAENDDDQRIPKDHKICMVYLVPFDNSGAEDAVLDDVAENIFNGLSCKDPDIKAIVTWQSNGILKPSIAAIIGQILEEESRGIIDPISEYTRHTLKALNSFISNRFKGYEFNRGKQASGLNKATEHRYSVNELKGMQGGFVGVKGGVSGLLKMKPEKIQSSRFQYSSQDMSHESNWIDLKAFNQLIEWHLDGKKPEIQWEGNFASEILFRIARDYQQNVFIGIRGGEKHLRDMAKNSPELVKGKSWQIGSHQPTSQWIPGDVFYEILADCYHRWMI